MKAKCSREVEEIMAMGGDGRKRKEKGKGKRN